MSEIKCPFCQQELESVLQLAGAGGLVEEAYLLCSKCNIRGERKLWQELIRTKKQLVTKCNQLEISVDALKEIKDGKIPVSLGIGMDINDALDKITALEQKE